MTIMRVTKTLSSPSIIISQKNYKKLDPQSIIATGNLVKSPPYDKINIKVARWHERWLVLYDTKLGIEILYYKKAEYQEAGEKPLGSIVLKNASVTAHLGSLHGFEYAIDIHTDERLWHLCTNDKPTHDTWLETLKSCCPPKELPKTIMSPPEPLQFSRNTIPELNCKDPLVQSNQSLNSRSPNKEKSKDNIPKDTDTHFIEKPPPTSKPLDQETKPQTNCLCFPKNPHFFKRVILKDSYYDEIFGSSTFHGPKLKKNSKKRYLKSRSCDDLLSIDVPKSTINNNSKEH